MWVIEVDTVADALPEGVNLLLKHGRQETSRAGAVLVAPMPVTTVYRYPTHRVLLSSVRDANPFFHLAEALWMLSGRDDTAFLNQFVRDFGERYAEPDGHLHGAYGYRWRRNFGFDQLVYVINTLRRDPKSRQCVIQMWDAAAADDLQGVWKDRPCNTHIYLRVRDGALDMTVCCRSNDIIWGAYGANAVHFSILQEYLAAMIGIEVGWYFQVSNNYHLYESELARLIARSGNSPRAFNGNVLRDGRRPDRLELVKNRDRFDLELEQMVMGNIDQDVTNPFLNSVYCAFSAHTAWRNKDLKSALEWAKNIKAPDWQLACVEWLQRRM